MSEPNTQAKGAKVVMGGNTKQPMFTLGYRVPTLTQLDEKLPYALDMLANILSGNSAARFDKKIDTRFRIGIGFKYKLHHD